MRLPKKNSLFSNITHMKVTCVLLWYSENYAYFELEMLMHTQQARGIG